MNFCEGCDLSVANDSTLTHTDDVDFEAMPAEIRFVCGKLIEGETHIDPQCAGYIQRANAAGKLTCVYAFARADADPQDDAEAFLKAQEPLALDLRGRPWLDVETMERLSPSALLSWMGGWLDRVEHALGMPPCIYTGPAFWNSLGLLARDPKWARYPLVIAHYGTDTPKVPAPWKDWTFHQYAANTIWIDPKTGDHKFGKPPVGARIIARPGLIRGVKTECDRVRYNGNYDDLRRFGGLDVAPLPPAMAA